MQDVKKMNDAIEEITRNKTVIVIAHKMSSIAKADKIIVMDNGRIAAQGTHDILYRECSEYRKLWNADKISSCWSLKGSEKNASYGA